MARYIQVASIGGKPPAYHPLCGTEEADAAILSHFKQNLHAVLPDKPDLIVFPEMCDFSLCCTMEENLSYIRNRGDTVLRFMRDVARGHATYVAYPTTRPLAAGGFAQSIYFINRVGDIACVYDKCCLTVGEIECGFHCGEGAVVAECELGRVGFAVCFDLNFTWLCDQYRAHGINLLLFASNFHGGVMQSHWAHCNQAYFVGAVNELPCSIVSPDGQTLASSTYYHPYVSQRINMDYGVYHLDFNREKIQAAKEVYGRALSVRDAGLTGRVMLSAEEGVHMADVEASFGIEPLSDYLRRAQQLREQDIESRKQGEYHGGA